MVKLLRPIPPPPTKDVAEAFITSLSVDTDQNGFTDVSGSFRLTGAQPAGMSEWLAGKVKISPAASDSPQSGALPRETDYILLPEPPSHRQSIDNWDLWMALGLGVVAAVAYWLRPWEWL